jgi:SAM-dependent methyltransferase
LRPEYKYNEATVRFYDIVYEKIADSGRTAYYLEEISKVKGPVLEAGVGTGMIFVPALKSGADVYGIDQSELMLGRLKEKLTEDEQKKISLHDIRNFSLDKKLSLVISPFRVFQHLLTIKDQLSALNCIYDHLEEGGKFIFDLFCPATERLRTEVIDNLEFESDYEPGKMVRRYYSVKPDYINQVQNVTFKYVWDDKEGEKISEYAFPMRYYFRFEVENLIARTEFKLENIFGDFKRSTLSNNSKEFIIVCRK